MGIVASGFGLGGLIIPVVTLLVDKLEWRNAMVAVGVGMLVIVLPLSFVMRHKPEQYGLHPDGETFVMGMNDTDTPAIRQFFAVAKPAVNLEVLLRDACHHLHHAMSLFFRHVLHHLFHSGAHFRTHLDGNAFSLDIGRFGGMCQHFNRLS